MAGSAASGNTRRESNNTEEVVYQAAVRLMAARGYHGASMRDVAGAVEMQMASLYYYFPSKQDLLIAIMSRTMHDLHAAVEPAIAAAGTAPEQLDAGIRAHISFHADRREETLVTDSELRALEGENRDAIIALRDAYSNMFTEILERGSSDDTFAVGDVHVATNALMTMCAGVAAWYRPKGRLNLSEIAAQLSHIFLRGVEIDPT